ncbi:MAG: tetratricopeptide repeat protein [Rhodospirillaceae bacterium]|nr:tetratricopeptide repeat protein [Rhodospirillaceae bacterium]
MNRAERRRQSKLARSGGGGNPDALVHQAMEQLQAGQLKRAEKSFDRVLKSHPEHPDALHFQGVVMYQQGRFEDSLTLLTAVVAIAPDYAEARNSLGIVLLEKRNFDNAVTHFEHALKVRPNFAGAHANLGNAHQEKGALDAAVKSYRTALSLEPQHREAAYRLASTCLAQGDAEQALEACAVCLEIDPHCQHALAYKAMALQALGRRDEARILYEYDRLFHLAKIAVPSRFDGLGEFNDVLAEAVRDHPSLVWEPFNRVTRGGAVSGDLLLQPTQTIKSFEAALRAAIDNYRDSLVEEAGHPLLGRIPKSYRLTLIASILKAGGHHPAHIHESAWLSGCYYVRVPEVVNSTDPARAGWLEFGRPDYPLAADSHLELTARQPQEGLALFFPSYFFHGTIPFEGTEERIGIAFDAFPIG